MPGIPGCWHPAARIPSGEQILQSTPNPSFLILSPSFVINSAPQILIRLLQRFLTLLQFAFGRGDLLSSFFQLFQEIFDFGVF
jgi:hypothetical protein